MHATKDNRLFIGLGGAGITILTLPEARRLPRLLLNTDTSNKPEAELFLQLGPRLLKGRCAGGYMFGVKAIDESYTDIQNRIGTATQITLVAGFAGGTGGAAPYLAEKLIDDGLQVSLVLCMPWFYEKEINADDKRLIKLEQVKSQLAKIIKIETLSSDLHNTRQLSLSEYVNRLNKSIFIKIEALCTEDH